MENKTCGECRYHKKNRCMLPCYTINHPAENSACHRFEVKTPPTNGDVIRQMSNRELAEFLSTQVICPNCPARTEHCIGNASKVCKKNWLAWLNAPAESEVENG